MKIEKVLCWLFFCFQGVSANSVQSNEIQSGCVKDYLSTNVMAGWNCGHYGASSNAKSSWGESMTLWGYFNTLNIYYNASPLNVIIDLYIESSLMYRYGLTLGSFLDDWKKNLGRINEVYNSDSVNTYFMERRYAGSLIVSNTVYSLGICLNNAYGKMGLYSGFRAGRKMVNTTWLNDLGSDLHVKSKPAAGVGGVTSYSYRYHLKSLSSSLRFGFAEVTEKCCIKLGNKSSVAIEVCFGHSFGKVVADYEYTSSAEISWNTWSVVFENPIYFAKVKILVDKKISTYSAIGYALGCQFTHFNYSSALKVEPAAPWFWIIGNPDASKLTNIEWIDVEISKYSSIFFASIVCTAQIFFQLNFC